MFKANAERYTGIPYRRCGTNGLKLPEVSLGLWHNFGDNGDPAEMRRMLTGAFDMGITHFDLANNYGPPPGSAEINFGKIMKSDLGAYRDELIISTKAGYLMWPGPYGEWGSRKYVLASLDQSLKRMGLDYVDIFYSHRFDPDTPLEETMGALEQAYRSGKALYVGISSYSPEKTEEAMRILSSAGIRCLIHQPSYSMLNRWVEKGLLSVLERTGTGCISFSPLAQGLLSDKYLNGIPADSRVSRGGALPKHHLNETVLKKIAGLNAIAKQRGQSLAQMAVAWVLRRPEITSALIGARNLEQIKELAAATKAGKFTAEELKKIDEFATESDINLWQRSSAV